MKKILKVLKSVIRKGIGRKVNWIPAMRQVLRGVYGTPLVVQGLRLLTANAGGLGLIPGQGNGSHMLQLSLHATTQTWCSQINA